MEREEDRGEVAGRRGKGRKRDRGREGRIGQKREEERQQPLQGHNHLVHQVLPWASALGLLSQQPFLEQACGLMAFYPRILAGSGPRLQPLSERILLAPLAWGGGGSFPFVLGFHHFSLLQV